MTILSRQTAPEPRHTIVVAGNSSRTLELLRLAVIGSDHVVLIAPSPDEHLRRFAERFAIEVHDRVLQEDDISLARAVLIAIDDPQAENRLVRAARQKRVPVHVAGRELVSDFRMMDFLEQRPLAA